MTDVQGPLFSLSAKGSLKKTLTYQKTKSGHKVYKHTKPGDRLPFTPSMAQLNQRGIIGLLVAQWQTMTDNEKAVWNDLAENRGLQMSGYHLFEKESQKDLYKYHGLVFYLSMNELSGNVVNDLSGNGINGALQPNYPAGSPTLVNSFNERLGNAYDFGGGAQRINLFDKPKLNISQNITVEALIRRDTLNVFQYIFAKRAGPNSSLQYVFYINSSNKLVFLVASPVDFVFHSVADLNNFPGGKRHVAASFDGSDLILFIDGDQVRIDSSYSGQINPGSGANMYVGYNSSSFRGIIDECRVYNRVLSPAEIKKHYNLFRVKK